MGSTFIRLAGSVCGAVPIMMLAAVESGRLAGSPEAPSAEIEFNDNVRSAGELREGVLTVSLEPRKGTWRLLGPGQPGREVLAFAEAGEAPQIPGPMVRVPEGTSVRITIRNPLGSDLVVHGLTERKSEALDSLVVPAGAKREVRFTADAVGTYYYWATTTGESFRDRVFEDSQLTGALIVDPADATATTPDRVLLLGMYFDAADAEGEPDYGGEFLVINGRPWPLTERLSYRMGDSIRWRLVNATPKAHPMHLHGFFYRIDARGDFARDTAYWPAERRMAVTENLLPGSTMSMTWSPDRPGAWLFHCHLNWHVTVNPSLAPDRETAEERDEHLVRGHHDGDPNEHVEKAMGGLMMVTHVSAPEGWRPDELARRELRLLVQSDSIEGDLRPRFGYVLQEGDVEPAPDSIPVPGSTIVARRGEPTAITVVNRLREATQVHWHGLEIESYYDGVAGVGGYGSRITPAIAPGDSFQMRITPPRTGSYMYHTHVNDIRQQGAGLYGAFVVLEEDEEWDPERDRVVMLSNSRDFGVLLNGTADPQPTTLVAGRTYRLRLMNITLQNPGLRVRLVRDGYPVRWLPVAKDGWDLPPHRRVEAEADRPVSIGETVDVEYSPDRAGVLQLEVRAGNGFAILSQVITVEDDAATVAVPPESPSGEVVAPS